MIKLCNLSVKVNSTTPDRFSQNHLSEAANKVVRKVSFVMEERSFPLGPDGEAVRRPAYEDLGGGQHVEAPGRCPPLCVLIINPQANLQTPLSISIVMRKDW